MSPTSPKTANLHCHILPLLPPITPNVTLPIRPTRLEFGLPPRLPSNPTSKSGKNGNVDHPSHITLPPPPLRNLRPQRCNLSPLLPCASPSSMVVPVLYL